MLNLPRSASSAGAFAATPLLLYGVYSIWRYFELEHIRRKALHLLCYGYVRVPSISPTTKRHIWERDLLPRLLNHWLKLYPSFVLEDRSTWPTPMGKELYATSYHNEEDNAHLPKLFSTNYEIQAIIAYLFDKDLKLVNYGAQSHWKFLLLKNPFHLLLSAFKYSQSCSVPQLFITGNEFGWHLLNWPCKVKEVIGTPIPRMGHMDNGEQAHYQHGIPPSLPQNNCDPEDKISIRLLYMLLWQIGIIFYCDSPGNLGNAQGATGFFPFSHIAVLQALRDHTALAGSAPIPFETFSKVFKDFGDEFAYEIHQVDISDGDALLALGPLIHTLMHAVEPMVSLHSNGTEVSYPRSIQNAKIRARDLGSVDELSDQMWTMIRHQDCSSSLLLQLVKEPLNFLSGLSFEMRENGMDLIENLKKQSKFILSNILTTHE